MPLVDWYRPLPARRLGRVVVWATLSTIGGLFAVGLAAFDHHLVDWARPILGLAGALLTIGGPLTLIIGFHRLLMRDDWFVALRLDALAVKLPELDVTIRWDDLLGAKEGPDETIELTLRDGTHYTVRQQFSGHTPREIAARIDSTRRRVAWNLPL